MKAIEEEPKERKQKKKPGITLLNYNFCSFS